MTNNTSPFVVLDIAPCLSYELKMEKCGCICVVFVVVGGNSDRRLLVRTGGEVTPDVKQSQQPDSAITVCGNG